MKRILKIVFVVLLLSGTAMASWQFTDGADRHVQMSDDAALTFPAGDFSIGGFIRVTSNAGADVEYIVGWGTVGADPSMWIRFHEGGHANANKVRMLIRDNEGDNALNLSTATPGADLNNWHHILWVRDGTDFIFYYDGVFDSNDALTGTVGACDVATTMKFGIGNDFDGGGRFGGDTAYWGKWDRALTQDEITGLAGGCDPNSYPTNLAWALPMIDFVDEQIGGITITEGTSAATTTNPSVAQCANGEIIHYYRSQM